MKKILYILLGSFLGLGITAFALSTFTVFQGGTGASTLTGCLQGNGTSAITGSGSNCAGSSPNVTYTTLSGTAYYQASSTATDNKSWIFNNGFLNNASSTFTSTATTTWNGPLVVKNNHTDQYMLGLTPSGNLGNSVAPVMNGALVVDNTLNTLTPGLYISSDQAGTPSNPLAIIRSSSASYGQGLLWLLGASTNTSGAAFGLKVQDANPDIEMVESDQSSPAGKYEIDINNDLFRFNGRSSADASFDTMAWFTRFDKDVQGGGSRFCLGCGAVDLTASTFNIVGTTTQGLPYFSVSSASTTAATGDKFVVNKSGNVGVASTTPGSLLSIGTNGGINFLLGTSTFGSSANGINVTNGCFSVNGTCVGGSSGSSQWTDISGGINYSGGKVGLASSTPWGLLSVHPNALGSGVPEFVVGSSSATHFVIDGAGNVGIGTANPSALLSVNGTGGTLLQAFNGATSEFSLSSIGDVVINRNLTTGGVNGYFIANSSGIQVNSAGGNQGGTATWNTLGNSNGNLNDTGNYQITWLGSSPSYVPAANAQTQFVSFLSSPNIVPSAGATDVAAQWINGRFSGTFGNGSESYNGTNPIIGLSVNPTINIAANSTGSYTALSIAPTETLLGSGITNYLIKAGTSVNPSLFVVTNAGYTGLGTSTPSPTSRLTISTTTTPQLSLSGNATDNIFTIRSIGNNLYIATSSPTTYATSSATALKIDQNGQLTISANAGVGCAQFTATGLLNNTGTACGSGTSSGGHTGDVGTSSVPVIGQIPYWTTTTATPALLGGVATGTVSVGSSALTATAGRFVLGGSLSIDCATATGSQTGCISSTDWTTFNGKLSSLDNWTHATVGLSATTTALAISTSTNPSLYPILGYSATLPQLMLSSGAGTAMSFIRSAGGNLFFGTTTVQGNATTSTAIMTLFGSGVPSLTIGSSTPQISAVNGMLILGGGGDAQGQTGTSTIEMARIQFDGMNSAGSRVCVFINSGNTLSVQAGACTP